MPKTVEIKLHRLTCEFADDEPGPLSITGSFVVLAYDVESAIQRRETLYAFPNGPIQLRKGESVEVDGEARVNLNAPTQDHPHKYAPDYMKFGGELTHLGSNWEQQRYDGQGVVDPAPLIWRLYFGKNKRIVRADFSTRFVNFS
jgi:hypothetical protein